MISHKRTLRIGLICLAVASGLALLPPAATFAFFSMLEAKFSPVATPDNFAPPADALEAQMQDVAHFAKIIALDRSFSAEARMEANRRIAELKAARSPLHPGQLRVAFHRIAALADNGHTAISWDRGERPNELPLRVTYFPDGLYVMRAKGENSDLLGARVEMIEGRPVEDVLTALEELQGGTKEWRRFQAIIYVIFPELLYGAGVAASPERSTWRFTTRGGVAIERTMAAAKHGESDPSHVPSRWLTPERQGSESEDWHALGNDAGPVPVALREFGRPFRSFWLDNDCVFVVQLKGIADFGQNHIGDFLRATEEEMRVRPPCNLILDMRFSGGGNYVNTYRFATRLPALIAPGGHLYILTAPRTFSAAITTVAFAKQAMAPRVTILGEPAGERLQFWAEGGGDCLPNSKICVGYATGMHDYQHPCRDWDRCFWLNWFYPVRVDTLEPDEIITMRFADDLAGRDPAFERAVELAKAKVR